MQVKTISIFFHSAMEYLDSYNEPLIEKTRSIVLSSLSSIHGCRFYKLVSVSEEEKRFRYLLDIDSSFEDINYVAHNNDLILFFNCGPDGSLLDK